MSAPNANQDGKWTPSKTIPRPGSDIFLSHRGDVKKNFVYFLSHLLKQVNLTCFVDELSLQPGDEAWTVITQNVQSACIRMPVLSRNYGDSWYCLEELRIMMENPTNIVKPIFFDDDFDSLQVTIQQSIRSACLSGQQRYIQNESAYRDALAKAFGKTGLRLENGDPVCLAKKVVDDVLETLDRPPLDVAANPVDIDRRVKAVLEKLSAATRGSKVVLLGLWGMGGIGKTTLAMAIYNKLRSEFAGSCCFLEVGNEPCQNNGRLVQLQQQMLEQLGSDPNSTYKFNSIAEGKATLKARLQGQKVLLVVDDIWSNDQEAALLGPFGLEDASPLLGTGSRVLVTSRSCNLIKGHEKHTLVEDVGPLDGQYPRELFCQHAFRSEVVPADLKTIVEDIIEACEGLPLALEVVGSFLHTRRKGDVQAWKDALWRLQQATAVAGTADNKLWDKLKLSYDYLQPETQQVFLDICCFALGKSKDKLLPAWGGSDALNCLVEWSLVRLSGALDDLSKDHQWQGLDVSYIALRRGKITILSVHDQLRDMGRMIANCANPPRHIWSPKALSAISMKGFDNAETMSWTGVNCPPLRGMAFMPRLRMLDLGKIDWDGEVYTHALACQQQRETRKKEGCCVRLLRATTACDSFVQTIRKAFFVTKWVLKDLVYLEWKSASCSALNNFLCNAAAHTTLVVLIVHVNITRFNVKRLRTEFLGNLKELQVLELRVYPTGNYRQNRLDLKEVPALGELTRLQALHLTAWRLSMLPESVSKLAELQALNLSGCRSLATLPESFGKLAALQGLDLSCCSLASLPESFGNLAALQRLDSGCCDNLASLPESFGNLAALQKLDLTGCDNLASLPESFGNLAALQHLVLIWCSLASLPKSFSNLAKLQELDLTECDNLALLPESFGNLAALHILGLIGCKSLAALPESFGNLAALHILDLTGCDNLTSLPESFGNLAALQNLLLTRCSLASLPKSFTLDLFGCKGLALPESFGNLAALHILHLSECDHLASLPESFGNLAALQQLDLFGCYSLASLPESFGNLAALQKLNLFGCYSLASLPESFGNLAALQQLDLLGCDNLASSCLPDKVLTARVGRQLASDLYMYNFG